MNSDKSETTEMLRKLMMACLAGLEAGHGTEPDLAVDGALPLGLPKRNQEFDQVLGNLNE